MSELDRQDRSGMEDIDAFFENLDGAANAANERLRLELEQLAGLFASPFAVPVFSDLLYRMGVASPLGATEAEAAMRNYGLSLLALIGKADPQARMKIVMTLFAQG